MKKEQNQEKTIKIDGFWAILVGATALLLAVCLTVMSIGLILDAAKSPSPSGGDGGGGAVQAGQNNTGGGQNVTGSGKSGAKTGITLPGKTASGTYLYPIDASTSAIDGISSAAAVLVDITDGKVVAQKNADVKIYPASMTKVMTLLVACENAKNPNALLTVTKEMVEKYKRECQGASVAFNWTEGMQVTVEDALHLIIYDSDTYACLLLADHISGGEEKFVELMNAKAKSLNLTSTNFTNCTGLYNDNHYTTCREMAAIMAAVMNNPTATAVITRKELYTVDLYEGGDKTEESKGMWSAWYTGRLESNRLPGVLAHYVGGGSDVAIVAGKTGYETVPTNCFVTAAENDVTQKRYVCVQVGRTDASQSSVSAKTSTNDTRYIYRKYAVE